MSNVRQTWWHQVIEHKGWKLLKNNSFSGTTICHTGYNGDDYSNRSFVTRMDNLGNPDVIFIFGATCFDYPNCIWLKLCEDNAYCYPEMREDKLNKIRQSMLKTYQNYMKEKAEEKKIDILPLADYYVVVTKNKESGIIKDSFTLNETGADMLKLFMEHKDTIAVAQAIAEMYGAPLEDVKTMSQHLPKH